MTLPSPGPVDALITWAQFKDLFERGIIQDPILYSGLTTLGTKFTVRRRIIVTRGARSIPTNRLTLQSVIITDSFGSGVPLGSAFILSLVTLPSGILVRIRNPPSSGKNMFVTQQTVWNTFASLYSIQVPALAALATPGGFTIVPKDGTSKSVANISNQSIVPPASDVQITGQNASALYHFVPNLGLVLRPDSSIDIYNSAAGNSNSSLEWFEQ